MIKTKGIAAEQLRRICGYFNIHVGCFSVFWEYSSLHHKFTWHHQIRVTWPRYGKFCNLFSGKNNAKKVTNLWRFHNPLLRSEWRKNHSLRFGLTFFSAFLINKIGNFHRLNRNPTPKNRKMRSNVDIHWIYNKNTIITI